MTTAPKNELTVIRVLDAPRQKVWRACRERDALMQWWGQPKGATMPFCKIDLRVGGSLHFEAENTDGTVIWVKCINARSSRPREWLPRRIPSSSLRKGGRSRSIGSRTV